MSLEFCLNNTVGRSCLRTPLFIFVMQHWSNIMGRIALELTSTATVNPKILKPNQSVDLIASFRDYQYRYLVN